MPIPRVSFGNSRARLLVGVLAAPKLALRWDCDRDFVPIPRVSFGNSRARLLVGVLAAPKLALRWDCYHDLVFALVRRILAAFAMGGMAATLIRLRGTGGVPPRTGGWREVSGPDLD